ncbi:MAG: T9SS type A sorting domain-containing protein [Saprospiraceae bacterium]|nr:T9SS type A sorting domain-containing protein [Saprospiraceae bacterium]
MSYLKIYFNILCVLILSAGVYDTAELKAQNIHDAKQSVIIEAQIQEQPAIIRLKWLQDTGHLGYRIYRKEKDVQTWGDSLAILGVDATEWTDSNVQIGKAHDYRILKILPNNNPSEGVRPGSGFIYSGMKLPPVHHRGSCLMVADDSFAVSLSHEIKQWMQDVEADGWTPYVLYVKRTDPVTLVKSKIKSWALSHPDVQQSVLLFGRIPVPYAGDIAPDGHNPDHKGAWPCDGYYGELHGNWTDSILNVNAPVGNRNDNLLRDGKFDNRFFPGEVKLQVGRVDFANMDKFPEGEEYLLKRYLQKSHQWRIGNIHALERGLIDNNFAREPEGLAQSGWKNYVAMFGHQQVKDLPYRTTLTNQSYMWSYGCGGGGPESASDISSTSNFVNDSLQTIFTMLFGSYFGDWDYPNNFLRAAIASRTILASTWGMRPMWHLQHMALGETIGYSTRLTMNNLDLFTSGVFGRFIHIGLMGDPTLRMHMMKPVQNLKASVQHAYLNLSWDDPDSLAAYYIYRKSETDSVYRLMNDQANVPTFYKDSCFPSGLTHYMVRAVQLKSSASGSYYNLSPGAVIVIDHGPQSNGVQTDFDVQTYFDQLSLSNKSKNASIYEWDFGDGSKSLESNPIKLYNQAGIYQICLSAKNLCDENTLCKNVSMVSSLPMLSEKLIHIDCFGDSTGQIELSATGGTPTLFFEWSGTKDTGRILKNLRAGIYNGELTTETGRKISLGPYEIEESSEIKAQFSVVKSQLNKNNGSIVLDVSGGCPPYQYLWNTDDTTANLTDLQAGIYCVSIQDCKSCQIVQCVELENEGMTAVKEQESDRIYFYPNPAMHHLNWHIDEWNGNNFQLRFFDLNGLELYQNRTLLNGPDGQINLLSLTQGIYFIQVLQLHTGNVSRYKLIKL